MMKLQVIREAMLRLSCIACTQYVYDPEGRVLGDGAIHHLLEVDNQFFMAWEHNNTGSVIVNPITRFKLDELDELGADEAWTVLRVPTKQTESIQFREVDEVELSEVYCRMAAQIA